LYFEDIFVLYIFFGFIFCFEIPIGFSITNWIWYVCKSNFFIIFCIRYDTIFLCA